MNPADTIADTSCGDGPTNSSPTASDAPSSRTVGFREALRVWVQIAAYSFGGLAGLWFGLHVLFAELWTDDADGVSLLFPSSRRSTAPRW
ncbi:hypothetical protein [Natrinema gelatinilyticum]|uniref:hypothetical protein n=1 Tax=Natrinema gelatinilyticum TaxID=2961571 RepID=UPI0020C21B17|nr:hypothetical protein [Natrinema gelatinilyticum]